MTFEEFKKQIEDLRLRRSELFTSKIRITDKYKKLCESSQSSETNNEEKLLKTLNNVYSTIDMPEGLLKLAYEKSSFPEKVIENIEKNLTEIEKLISEIF